MFTKQCVRVVVAAVLLCFVASFALAGTDKKKVIAYTGMPKTLTFFINLSKSPPRQSKYILIYL